MQRHGDELGWHEPFVDDDQRDTDRAHRAERHIDGSRGVQLLDQRVQRVVLGQRAIDFELELFVDATQSHRERHSGS